MRRQRRGLVLVVGSLLFGMVGAGCSGRGYPGEEGQGGGLGGGVAQPGGGPVATPVPPGTVDCGGLSTRRVQTCTSNADCNPGGELCYIGPQGTLGACLSSDADIWCDGEGDLNLQSRPAMDDLGPGLCVRTAVRDLLCCLAPTEWECPPTQGTPPPVQEPRPEPPPPPRPTPPTVTPPPPTSAGCERGGQVTGQHLEPYQYLDLDQGILFNDLGPAYEIHVAFDGRTEGDDVAVAGVIVYPNPSPDYSVGIAHLPGRAFDDVTSCDIEQATFYREYLPEDFRTRTLLVLTTDGAVYKLGNAVEDGTREYPFAVRFDRARLR